MTLYNGLYSLLFVTMSVTGFMASWVYFKLPNIEGAVPFILWNCLAFSLIGYVLTRTWITSRGLRKDAIRKSSLLPVPYAEACDKISRPIKELIREMNLKNQLEVAEVLCDEYYLMIVGRRSKDPLLIYSQNLLLDFEESEIKALFAHELSHLKRDHAPMRALIYSINTILKSIFNPFFWVFCFIVSESGNDDHSENKSTPSGFIVVTLLLLVLSPLFSKIRDGFDLILYWVMRRQELRADKDASRICGKLLTKKALVKLHGATVENSMVRPTFANLRAKISSKTKEISDGYPTLYKRIKSLDAA